MDYINYKIKGLQDEIDSKLEYIEKLKLIDGEINNNIQRPL